MRVWDRSTRVWDGFAAFSFVMSAYFVCWALFIAASFGPDFRITIRSLQFAIDTKFILLTAAIFIPALYCFVSYPECRSSVKKVNANWKVYFAAIAIGVSLPFLSYPGTHYYAFPWGRPVAVHLSLVFGKNLFLSPFWEEIIWRGCFLKKIRSFSPTSSGILLMSIAWSLWHGGYIAFLYSEGIPVSVLRVLPFTYFCLGIILGSVFLLGGESLWPCVLLHTSFNAATVVYYTPFNRSSELGSYVSELIFTAITAAVLLWIVIRRSRSPQIEASTSPLVV